MDIETLISQYSTYIYNFALKLSCHPHIAEDLSQETFIKAWENLSTLQNPKAIKPWLRKICLNQFLMLNRKNSTHPTLSLEDIDYLEADAKLLQSQNTSPEDEVIVAETIQELQNGCFLAMVRRLTLHQRLAFSLIDMFGLSIKETSELIGVSEKAAKGLLYRARMNLDAFFHNHCNLLSVSNPCSCSAWIEFSKMRANNQKASQKFQLVDHLDYTECNYTFNLKTRHKLHYLYTHMPDKKPPESWYQEVIALLQTRTIPISTSLHT